MALALSQAFPGVPLTLQTSVCGQPGLHSELRDHTEKPALKAKNRIAFFIGRPFCTCSLGMLAQEDRHKFKASLDHKTRQAVFVLGYHTPSSKIPTQNR